jgi:hypothetical protein
VETVIGLVRALLGGGIGEQLRRAYEARLAAQNDAARLDLDGQIARMEAAQEMARIANADRWSATSLGRYLIVVPFGLWWAAIYLVQILNPWFGLSLVVVDVPPRIHDLAVILIPAIVIADAGALTARRLRKT